MSSRRYSLLRRLRRFLFLVAARVVGRLRRPLVRLPRPPALPPAAPASPEGAQAPAAVELPPEAHVAPQKPPLPTVGGIGRVIAAPPVHARPMLAGETPRHRLLQLAGRVGYLVQDGPEEFERDFLTVLRTVRTAGPDYPLPPNAPKEERRDPQVK